jgi:flagellar hook-associated protein 3 FlgL
MTSISSSTPVVITPSVLSSSLINDLTTDQASLANLQTQIASGNQINTASDNPSGAAQMLQLQSATTRANQYAANAENGASMLSLGNSTVNSVLTSLQSLMSTLTGLSGQQLSGQSTVLASAAQQANSTLQQLLGLANSTFSGQPLFAGTGNSQQAYDAQGNYVGAGQAPTRTVAPSTQVAASVTGPEIFGSGTTGLLSSVPGSLGVLAQIASDLNTGSAASLANLTTTDIPNLQSALGQVESAAGQLGSQQDAMQNFQVQATSTVTSLQGQLSSVQDVNMAEAMTNLQLQNTAYQAALYATSQISTASLTQYL